VGSRKSTFVEYSRVKPGNYTPTLVIHLSGISPFARDQTGLGFLWLCESNIETLRFVSFNHLDLKPDVSDQCKIHIVKAFPRLTCTECREIIGPSPDDWVHGFRHDFH